MYGQKSTAVSPNRNDIWRTRTAKREPREENDLRAVAHHRLVQRGELYPVLDEEFLDDGRAACRAMTNETPAPTAQLVPTSATPRGVP